MSFLRSKKFPIHAFNIYMTKKKAKPFNLTNKTRPVLFKFTRFIFPRHSNFFTGLEGSYVAGKT